MMAAMAALTIGFDVTSTIVGATGVARYVREVDAGLEALPDPPVLRRFAVGRATVAEGPAADVVRVRTPLRIVDRSWRWGGPPSVERLVGPVDSVHAAGPVLPTTRRPVVAVVHDLAPLDHPDLHPARDVAQLRRYVAGLHRVAAVVTGSQATADRLADRSPGLPVHVTPWGRSPLAAPEAPPLAGRPYVLVVGAPVPRKGYDSLLRAVARLAEPDLAVAIVGPAGSDDELLARVADEVGLSRRVHRARDVTDAELAGWYAGATVLAAPSIEEGFSFPVVEAQGLGVPVVISDIQVHREVAGPAACFVPVGDIDELAQALEAVLAGGAGIGAAVEAGKANAARFTWAACAAATAAVHRDVVGAA
jgi:glycosyltransferase involved in cell wall biosynthesis